MRKDRLPIFLFHETTILEDKGTVIANEMTMIQHLGSSSQKIFYQWRSEMGKETHNGFIF